MIKKTALLTAAAMTVVPLAMAVAPSAVAAQPGVRITNIYVNSPGTDNGSNKSLNAEWVRIKNFTASRKTLTHWTLRDTSGHVYRFPTFHLSAGAAVRVHTGRGINAAHNLYWRSDNYIWNNTGDTAMLKRANGVRIDRCHYTDAAGPEASC